MSDAVAWLFVPGDREERFSKAAQSGAGAVIIDLEDAVAPAHKTLARKQTAAFFRGTEVVSSIQWWIRINSPESSEAEEDCRMIAELPTHSRLAGLVVPKCSNSGLLEELAQRFPNLGLIPLIETVAGVDSMRELLRVPQTQRVAVGAEDLSAELGVEPDSAIITQVKYQTVIASAAAGKDGPLDSPPTRYDNPFLVQEGARIASEFGMSGSLCIHPAQVHPIIEGFQPSNEKVRWAKELLKSETQGAAGVSGQMVDAAVLKRAVAILNRAAR